MKIVFTSMGKDMNSQIDPRFGRAHFLVVYDTDTKENSVVDTSEMQSMEHGAGPAMSQKVMEIGADSIITGNGPGGNAGQILSRSNIKIFAGAHDMTLSEALTKYENNELKEFQI